MERGFSVIAWDEAQSFRNAAPGILSGHLGSRLCKVLSISVEQRDGEGDDCVVAVRHLEIESDEAIACCVVEASNLDSVRALRGNDGLSHLNSFRVRFDAGTIASTGSASSTSGGGDTPQLENTGDSRMTWVAIPEGLR